jgi:hypothetical protein
MNSQSLAQKIPFGLVFGSDRTPWHNIPILMTDGTVALGRLGEKGCALVKEEKKTLKLLKIDTSSQEFNGQTIQWVQTPDSK